MDILQYIPHGRENAISRRELCRITGLDDRVVRQEIKRLVRDKGIPILSSSAARGYWISESFDEMRAYVRENDTREATLRRNVDPIRQIIEHESGKETVYVKSHYRRRHKEPEPPRQIEGQISLGG